MINRLKLISIKTEQDEHSNSVIMTFIFKIRDFNKDIRCLELEVNRKIKEMICFDFYNLSSCDWGDSNCKTIQKSILFNLSKNGTVYTMVD